MTRSLPVRGPGRRSRRSQRRATRWLDRSRVLSAILMLAAGGALYAVAVSPAFAVTTVTIEGGALTDQAALDAAIGLPAPAANSFRVETDAIRGRVARLPGVERAEVSVSLPGTLHVRLVERQAVLTWQVGDHRFLVARDGYVIADAGVPEAAQAARDLAASLPTVVDHRPDTALAAAARAEAKAAEIRAAAAAPDAEPAAGGEAAGGTLTAGSDASNGGDAVTLGPAAPTAKPKRTATSKGATAGASAKPGRAAATPSPGKASTPAKPGASPKPGKAGPSPAPARAAGADPGAVGSAADRSPSPPFEGLAGAAGGPGVSDAGAPAGAADGSNPEVTTAVERVPGVPVPGETLGILDMDIATRLLSLVPADIGSTAPRLQVSVDPTEGWLVRPVADPAWTAVFGLYAGEIRKASMIPDQVRVLRSLLVEIGEDHLKRAVLADANGGTYTERR